MKYTVIVAKMKSNYCAHCPDVPGCMATGKTFEETLQLFKEALEFHFEGLKEDGESIPQPSTHCEYVEVDVDAAINAA
ncbi:MAG: type II toxin-antitoxin system HicB family antitoxin [Candidatus Omnitrophota bacterium]